MTVIIIGAFLVGAAAIAYLILAATKRDNLGLREMVDNGDGRMKAIFKNAPAELYLKDSDGKYIMVNPQFEKLFGVKNSDILGLLPTDIHEPELGAKTRAHDLLVLSEHKTVVRDEIALTKIGLRTLHTIKFPTFDSSGNLTGLGAVVTDVTELRIAEQEMRQSQKMDAIGQLTGGVAHDFNNLLAIIMGNLELHGQLEDETEKQECIQIAISASQRGADLTKNLLSFAKKAPLSPEVFNVIDLAIETNKWSSRILPDNIQFELINTGAIRDTLADKTMAQSAFLNVILNAKDAMPTGGVVTIKFLDLDFGAGQDLAELLECRPGKYVCIKVTDTGTGIPSGNLKDIFTPFFSTKTTGSGSGLGLSMVQGFMKQSGGAVAVTSEMGVGTTVSMYLPAAESLPKQTTGTQRVVNPPPKRTGRVLLAEDNDDVRHWIARFLKLAGNDVFSAPTGDAAFSLFSEDPDKFDLLVTDIIMPGELQGPSLADEVRKRRPSLPVIFLSGYSRDAFIDGRDYLSGAAYLMKPVAADTLTEAVHRALRPSTETAKIPSGKPVS